MTFTVETVELDLPPLVARSAGGCTTPACR